MKRTIQIAGAVLLSCSAALLAQSPMTSAADTKFAMNAAQGGMAEVKMGQLAASKGSSDFVKQFGQKMVDDHSKANDQLKAVAAKDNMTLPTDLNAKDQAEYDKLSKLSGSAFDKEYERTMLADHKIDVAAFKKESMSGKNPDLKSFAGDTLPTLQEHLHIIETKKM
jgi:putative membrane protein